MIDKNWIFQKDRLSEEFFNGLKNFLKLSSFHLNDENKIRCPCVSCMNLYYYDLETIERHIFVRGFYTKYVLWEFHGEDITEIHEDEENAESIVEEDNTLYDIMSNKKSRDLPLSRTRSFGPKKTHNNDSTSTKSPPPLPCSPNEDSTTPSDDEIQELLGSKKNTRGPTRGDGVRRSSKNDTSKKIISYRKGELRVYGPNATIFGNTVGVKVRHHAPLQYSGWAKIPPEDKKAVYARIMDIFDIDFKKDPYLETICNHYCQERYRGYRNKCHSKYKSLIEEGKNPLENRPKKLVLIDEDWEWMCKNCFSNEEWKKSKQSIGDEVQQQTMKCGEIEMFRKTHYTIENGWIKGIAKEKYISVELSSKHKEIEEERLDKLEKIIEDLRKNQDNNVARIVQENMKIFYESQQGRLLEERSSESPIRIPSMDKQNSFFTQLEPTLDSCQAQNAMTMADRMEGTEAGQFWLLSVNIGTFDYYNASSNRQPKKSGITWKSIKKLEEANDPLLPPQKRSQ
ncbi:hypothetical protein F8388_002391 [Cannabis sativa]|uniref:Transposase-associated domain-containing protein n=1 Tax=Cannabis sativa TaxID=3483 RepID=A0A7J6EGA8_CANSA|nr:hypothetical protein F8388_002391 [Cannabis sativa]